MKLCMYCGEVEMFETDAQKSYDKYGRVYCDGCIDKLLNTSWLLKCDFNDECDTCGNPNKEQSWAKMAGCEDEVECYLCQPCAVKHVIKVNEQNKFDH